MNRLLLRFSLGILAALIISMGCASFILWQSLMVSLEGTPPAFARSLGYLGDEMIAQWPEDKLAALTLSIEQDADAPIRVLNIQDPRIPDAAKTRLKRGYSSWGSKWSSGKRDDTLDGAMLFLPMPNGKVLMLGPQQGPIPDPITWVWIIAAIVSVVSIAGMLLSRPIVKQLNNLERAAQKITAGELSARAKVGRDGAGGSVAATFNAMAERNEELLDNQRQIVQAVAHELRTPISRIRFNLEMADMEPGSADSKRRQNEVAGELTELDGLVGELLTFSRYDAGAVKLSPARVEIEDMIRRQIDRIAPLHPNVKIVTSTGEEGDTEEAVLDPKSFDRVLHNLLVNAARYAKSEVRVNWAVDDGVLTVRVIDDGPGIPVEQRRRVFDPFVRLDQSRSRASGGAGLGLAIVLRIMKTNRGEVHVEESSSGGVLVVTCWPIS
jgi:two-component system, OmpR family, sensor histidine kinase RstB